MKLLLINTHLKYPGWSEGKLNQTFFNCAKEFFLKRGDEVIETVVEEGYDANEEVDKHLAADVVILQTPVNWFSTPWIHKKYIDEVFNAALARKALLLGDGRTRHDSKKQYGTGGLMSGRKFMISATWNAPEEAFENSSGVLFEGKSRADLFLHITSNYKFCDYEIIPDFGVFDIFKNPDIDKALGDYETHLAKHFG